MKPPVIHKSAARRMGEIWDYTVEKWGEEQADRYLRTMAACIQALPDNRSEWKSVRDRRLPGVFCVRCGHHFLFFREIENQIAVISILHESMDIPRRLRDDALEDS